MARAGKKSSPLANNTAAVQNNRLWNPFTDIHRIKLARLQMNFSFSHFFIGLDFIL